MKNKKNTNCCWCGEFLSAGTGIAFYVDEEDEMLGFAPMGATGWMAKCDDRENCKQRQQQQKEDRKNRLQEEQGINELERTLFPMEREYQKKQIIEDLEHSIFPQETQFFGGFGENRISLNGIEYHIEGKERTIYGGGQWYVDTGEYVWKCYNNGMDGDDWSQNNIRTGGAGAIGYRYKRTQDRLNFLNQHTINYTVKRQAEEKEEQEREEKKKSEIRAGLKSMLARGVTWEMIEKSLTGKHKTFCPKELTVNGRSKYDLTIEEAKKILKEGEVL